MPRIRVTGDILTAFSVEVDVEDVSAADITDSGFEEFKQQVADALGLKRYNAEEGLTIGDIEEV